ncbi:Hint domain-containing protein [Acidisoma silvae]|uniref:Hint domain-containing protein n=1 Tax=Acidisoma silvae TaxID=2802396 RepID=A0A963YSJ1_9PROT|nr:Hint domain-containing protein [Acidisoma silvae]MCB8875727.1 Hint domain-containing protein [Acidisoma silvae]
MANSNGVTYTYTGTTLTRTYNGAVTGYTGSSGSLASVTSLPSSNVFTDGTTQTLTSVIFTTSNYAVMNGVTDTVNVTSLGGTINLYVGGTTTINSSLSALSGLNVFVDGGSATLAGGITALSGAVITLDNGGTFTNGTALLNVLSGITVNYSVNGGTFLIDGNGSAATVSGVTINNFSTQANANLEFAHLPSAVTSYTISGTGNQTITLLNGSTTIGTVTVNGTSFATGTYTQGQSGPLTFSYDGNGDIFVSAGTSIFYCFLPGTHILTPQGEVLIEDLRDGDMVITASGESVPIAAITTSRLSTQFADHSKIMPVRIAAGAFAEGLPTRDLYVSPDHSFFFDGVLVPAQLLINGSSIRQVSRAGEITYYHLELEPHDLIIAEGVVTESFLNTGGRQYQSQGSVVTLLPPAEPKTWEDACAPLLLAGPRLEAIRAALNGRAEIALASSGPLTAAA